jgi:hypothetical protein
MNQGVGKKCIEERERERREREREREREVNRILKTQNGIIDKSK